MEPYKQRDFSIDIIKSIAVLLIINSHADICYPICSYLATGGAIGDSLFLFCSGYTLFKGNFKRFDNWYKCRISRIFPSVVSCFLISVLLCNLSLDKLNFLYTSRGEFLLFIMIYYIILYIVQKLFFDHIPLVIGYIALIILMAYWFFPYKNGVSYRGIYGTTTLFRWIPYFSIMLIGAWMGLKSKTNPKIMTTWKDLGFLILCLSFFYGLQFAAKKVPAMAPWQIVTIPFLAGIVYFFWRCCNAVWLRKVYETKIGNWFIMAIGGLCLESYLIQFSLFTDKLNFLFPLNIPLMMLIILVVSYVCRCIARAISQTFRTEDYEWKKVFAII